MMLPPARVSYALSALLVGLVALALIFGREAEGQEAPPAAYAALEERVAKLEATGEQNLLKLACNVSVAKAQREGLAVRWCRLEGVAEHGDYAQVKVRVNIQGQGIFVTTSDLIRTPWVIENWGAVYVP